MNSCEPSANVQPPAAIVELREALRLRRLKANLMTATAYRGLEQILKPLVGFLEEGHLAKAWAARDQNANRFCSDFRISACVCATS